MARVAASAEIEFHAAGTAIIESAEATSEFVYVVRRGSVELVTGDRLMDVLGEGEMFGFLSLLHGGPLGFVARAAEDTLVYRIPAAAVAPVFERTAAARFVARHPGTFVYGAGAVGTYLVGRCAQHRDHLAGFLDRNPFKVGGHHLGLPVHSPLEPPPSLAAVVAGLAPTRARGILAATGLAERGVPILIPDR